MPSVTIISSLLLLLLSRLLCADRVHGAMQKEEQHAHLHPDHLSVLRPNASASSSLRTEVHIVFSTDCTKYMDWQSLVLFHSARSVRQKGPVTRIASGCSESKMKELVELYAKLYPGYRVHFTPNYGEMTGFKYSNKPMGVDHWLRHADPPVRPDTIVALLDPDMILLRPITASILEMDNLWSARHRKTLHLHVTRGKPAGAAYAFGAAWTGTEDTNFSKLETCGPDSPCLDVKERFALNHFSAGPPLLMHRDDLVRVASTWSRFMPSVLKRFKHILTDMFAYAMAAAHEQLPHVQLTNYMVSDVDAEKVPEGWPMVDRLNDVCASPVDGIFFRGRPLPSVIHYCNFYQANQTRFIKFLPILDYIVACDHPLLQEPPPDLAHIRSGDSTQTAETNQSIRKHNRNAFAICTIVRSINEALIHYKRNMCDMRTANMAKLTKFNDAILCYFTFLS